MSKQEWPLFEIFIRAKSGLSHRHVGSLHAPDAQMAIDHARDLYTRRGEGVSIWAIESKNICASDPAESTALFEPAEDKITGTRPFMRYPKEWRTCEHRQ